MVPKTLKPIEKVAAEPFGTPEPGSKRPKNGLSAPKRLSEKSSNKFFNRLTSTR